MAGATIAITGATGFIGAALARRLLHDGFRVRALVRPGSLEKLKVPSLEAIVGTLDDESSVKRWLDDASCVVHCAGAVRGASTDAFCRTNVTASVALARICAPRVSRFVVLSSLAASEPQLSAYAASKRAQEESMARAALPRPCLFLRPPAVYGLGDKEMMPLFKLMSRGWALHVGPADNRFSLLYIDDLVEAVLAAIKRADPLDGVYELHDGTANGYSMNEVIAAAEQSFGHPIHSLTVAPKLLDWLATANIWAAQRLNYQPMLTPWKLRELRHRRWVCDNARFSEATGWQPQIALRRGIRVMNDAAFRAA